MEARERERNNQERSSMEVTIGNIFEIFERNYQIITQDVRDKLLDFIDTYTADKVLYAINEGITHNARSISYIEAILKGKKNGKSKEETSEEKKARRVAWQKERGII